MAGFKRDLIHAKALLFRTLFSCGRNTFNKCFQIVIVFVILAYASIKVYQPDVLQLRAESEIYMTKSQRGDPDFVTPTSS